MGLSRISVRRAVLTVGKLWKGLPDSSLEDDVFNVELSQVFQSGAHTFSASCVDIEPEA